MPELVGFAVLPADTFAEGPSSGNFINTDNREAPFDGQPVQGFSGVQFAPGSEDGSTFWFLSDNGFGAQDNSADYLLRLYQVDPDFAGTEDGDGSVDVQAFVQLADPNNLIPFDIINEDTSDRLLTGADFDIESFVIDNNGDIWIGEEFGPYILHFDNTGTLLEAPIATPSLTQLNTLNGQEPLVIGHRGASGDIPEHTLAAYEAAIASGADFIEPDLVITSDGVLIARHEPLLDDTTNVAEVFGPERQSTKLLDGVETTGYFAEDFTHAEIKQLRAVQSRDYRDLNFDGLFEIPTLEEVIQLVQRVEAETGVEVGIYPETKHPTFFDEQELSLEEPLIETLQDTGFTDPGRIFIQSFEFANLIDIQQQLDDAGLGNIPLVQLYGNTTEGANPEAGFSFPFDIRFNVEQENDLEEIYGQEFLDAVEVPLSENTVYADLDSAEFLDFISGLYAEGAGPWKNNILLRESLETDVDGDGDGEAEIGTQLTGEITSFIEDAHDAGLQVHPYTLRDEERFLTLNPNDTEEFDAPQLIVSALIGIERPGGNATLYSRIDPTQTEEQGNNVEPFFDFTFSPADLVLDPDTGIVTTPSLPFFIAPEFAEEIGKPELAGEEAGFFVDNFALELDEETGEFVIVGGPDSHSFNSIFVSEDFLNDNDLEIIQGTGLVDPIETDVDTTGFVGFGFPLSENADVRFGTDPDTGLLIPLGGAYVADGSISFEVLGTGTPQTAEEEFEQLIEIGADGFFTDFPRTGDPVRDALVSDEVRSPQNPNLNDFNTLDGSAPIVIGHRGASGQFPEHTLEAYRLAIVQGADFVEPDLVITSDGVLIARHEPMLGDTTNVADVFPDRETTKILDGEEVTDYFAEDFTLAEIKQLRAVQSRDFRDQSFNGEFEIPTFQEVIELVQEMEEFGFEVGIYPETKHPTFFDEQDLSLEEPLIQTLQDTGFTDPDRIFIQSFEVQNLLELRNEILPAEGLENLKLVQLLGDTEDEFINEGGGGFSVPFDFVANSEQFEPTGINAITDQVNYATFTGSAFTVTLLAEKNPGPGAPQEILDQFGNLQDTNQFILQDATNPDNTVVLFAGLDSAPKSIEVTISEAGVVAINGDQVANNFSQQVHFGLINSLPIGDPTGLGAESYTFSTNNDLNPESDPQFAVYSEVENEFIIAAEELPFANSNQDFDDMIVKVSGIDPVGETQADISFDPERLQPLLETANTRAIYGNLADLIDFSSDPTYADLANQEVIELISSYADGLGPWKNSFLLRNDLETPVDGDGDGEAEITTQLTGEVLPLIDWAHDAGLQVHPYTLRDEERFLTLNADGTPQTPGEEFEQLIEIGADGFFTDFPATGSIVVDQFISEPNLARTRGYEGMAFSPDRETFYPLLEGAVDGDPNNALRIYEFDPATSSFEDEPVGFYPTDVPGHAIGDFTPINDNEFLVIERDGGEGDEAQFKKIFKIDISVVDEEGFVYKEEVVDLLDIDDPNDLNGDGDTNFSFPFVTIEDVLVLDEDTILVANDNNYPFSIGRGPDIDNNEIIQIELDEPLDLAPGIGVAIPTVSIDIDTDTVDEDGDQYSITFDLNVPAPEGGLRVVWSETDSDDAFGDISFPPELTNASEFESLGTVGDELALSAITIEEGATTATVTWTTLFDGIVEGDETTIIELQPEDAYEVDPENQVAEVVIEDTPITVGIEVEPGTVNEEQDEYSITFNLSEPAPEGGLRVVWSETDSDNELGDISFPPELTNASEFESLGTVGDELALSAITIEEGATTATVTWTTLFDGIVEGDETTTIELQPEDGYEVDPENQVAEIVIEDTPITVGIEVEPDTVNEGDEYSITFNLSEPAPEGGVRVVWSETDSDNSFGDLIFPPELTNASNFEDLTDLVVGDELARSAITIEEGETTATVTWTTIFDGVVEGDETTTIELQPEDAYAVDAENQVAQIVIEDTDPDPGEELTGTAQGERIIGGTGNDTIIGLNGADTLVGNLGDDSIIGSRGNDILRGQDGDDTLQGRKGNDRLLGGDGNDVLNGGQGRDRINGGPGFDILFGGASIDRFIYNSNQPFEEEDLGIDLITDFQPDLRPDEDGNQGDLILLDKSTFTELDSAAGIGFSVDSDFEIVATDDEANDSDALIVYSEESGLLFYLYEGNLGGDSTLFTQLEGAPTITEDNFQIRN
ncbi:glycerophosphodiester phosphodiesterase family protein [Dapis sp. BLCC M172]|uniref:glycerophosphodiester phosphodiesterase family protein n=1 Tax=Dapis sp. BLCC M172 TaxID=2975281 RepID=UPI003CFB0978